MILAEVDLNKLEWTGGNRVSAQISCRLNTNCNRIFHIIPDTKKNDIVCLFLLFCELPNLKPYIFTRLCFVNVLKLGVTNMVPVVGLQKTPRTT